MLLDSLGPFKERATCGRGLVNSSQTQCPWVLRPGSRLGGGWRERAGPAQAYG